jgi:hypothetical protein
MRKALAALLLSGTFAFAASAVFTADLGTEGAAGRTAGTPVVAQQMMNDPAAVPDSPIRLWPHAETDRA